MTVHFRFMGELEDIFFSVVRVIVLRLVVHGSLVRKCFLEREREVPTYRSFFCSGRGADTVVGARVRYTDIVERSMMVGDISKDERNKRGSVSQVGRGKMWEKLNRSSFVLQAISPSSVPHCIFWRRDALLAGI